MNRANLGQLLANTRVVCADKQSDEQKKACDAHRTMQAGENIYILSFTTHFFGVKKFFLAVIIIDIIRSHDLLARCLLFIERSIFNVCLCVRHDYKATKISIAVDSFRQLQYIFWVVVVPTVRKMFACWS